MAGCKYHIYLELHDPKSPLGINPPLPAWQRIANALTELFDILRQNRSDLVHYGSLQHDIYLLPEHLVKRAEEREEQELARALLDSPAKATTCGAGLESQPQGKQAHSPRRSTPGPDE